MKKILHIITFIILFIWQLPQCLLGLLMLPFMGKLELISYKKYCFAFKAKNMPSGISLGTFAYLSYDKAKKTAIVAHEQEGHTVDSKRWGPLYLLVIGIPSLLNNIFEFTECYYDFYTERWANKHANLEVLYTANGRYFLEHKNVLDLTQK